MRRFHAARPVLAIFLLVSSAWAGHHSTGRVHVDGYTTRSGHYVVPYTRSAPHSSLTASPDHGGRSTSLLASGSTHPSTRTAVGVTRDTHGRIKRSEVAKRDFERQHPCPSTGKTSGACPGYVVDHIVPLKRGGADDPSNMQWQTTEAAKAKDRWV